MLPPPDPAARAELEVFQTGLDMWMPLEAGSEQECQARMEWYLENRPELVDRIRVVVTPEPEPEVPEGDPEGDETPVAPEPEPESDES